MKTTKIWPEIEINKASFKYPFHGGTREIYAVAMETWVRRKAADGRWYVIYLFRKHYLTDLGELITIIQEFNNIAYSFNLLYIVDKQSETIALDNNQESEEERFSKLMKPFAA